MRSVNKFQCRYGKGKFKMNTQDQAIDKIERKIKITNVIDTFGSIFLGLGIYGKFGANGDAFHPILNDELVVNALLVIGAGITFLGMISLAILYKRKNRLACKPKN